MAAGKYNLIIDQGSDFGIQLTLSENEAPVDLTGFDARAQMRQNKSDATVSGTFTCVVTDAINGVINMAMLSAATSILIPGKHYYDLEIYTAGDVAVNRLLSGNVNVTAEVTR